MGKGYFCLVMNAENINQQLWDRLVLVFGGSKKVALTLGRCIPFKLTIRN